MTSQQQITLCGPGATKFMRLLCQIKMKNRDPSRWKWHTEKLQIVLLCVSFAQCCTIAPRYEIIVVVYPNSTNSEWLRPGLCQPVSSFLLTNSTGNLWLPLLQTRFWRTDYRHAKPEAERHGVNSPQCDCVIMPGPKMPYYIDASISIAFFYIPDFDSIFYLLQTDLGPIA